MLTRKANKRRSTQRNCDSQDSSGRQEVRRRPRQVRNLTMALVRAEQRERRRLSAALHDDLQQLLYGVQLKLQMARDNLAAGRRGDADQHLVQAEDLLQRSVKVTRQLSVDLNPPILKNEGLKAILAWLQGQMKELHGLDIDLDAGHEIKIDDSDVRVLLFQVFRELLFNIAKHSAARKASVSLKERDGELVVGIADDVRGFDADAAMNEANLDKATVGLMSVRERVGLLGGELRVESRPGAGTIVTVQVPKSAKIGV